MNRPTDPRKFPFPPAIPILALLLSWGLSNIWPLHLSWPAWTRSLGWVLLATAVLIAVSAIATFRRHHTSPDPRGNVVTIVTDGPFRYSRNPMYVSLMLIQTGVMLTSGMGWALILLAPTFLILQYMIVVPEERYLESAFGESYTAYRQRVRRWL